jgi:hypothetical protein
MELSNRDINEIIKELLEMPFNYYCTYNRDANINAIHNILYNILISNNIIEIDLNNIEIDPNNNIENDPNNNIENDPNNNIENDPNNNLYVSTLKFITSDVPMNINLMSANLLLSMLIYKCILGNLRTYMKAILTPERLRPTIKLLLMFLVQSGYIAKYNTNNNVNVLIVIKLNDFKSQIRNYEIKESYKLVNILKVFICNNELLHIKKHTSFGLNLYTYMTNLNDNDHILNSKYVMLYLNIILDFLFEFNVSSSDSYYKIYNIICMANDNPDCSKKLYILLTDTITRLNKFILDKSFNLNSTDLTIDIGDLNIYKDQIEHVDQIHYNPYFNPYMRFQLKKYYIMKTVKRLTVNLRSLDVALQSNFNNITDFNSPINVLFIIQELVYMHFRYHDIYDIDNTQYYKNIISDHDNIEISLRHMFSYLNLLVL